MTRSPRRSIVHRCFAAFTLSALAACGREPAGIVPNDGAVPSRPIAFLTEFPSALPAFQAAGGGGVEFTKVHIVLRNADGSIALEKDVEFPAGSDELTVTLSVNLPANSPASGTPLALDLDYKNAAGETVFHGGPVTVNAVPAKAGEGPPPPSPVTIPIAYTGQGADAAGVQITPKSITVNTGQQFSVSAFAVTASGIPILNTPIVFSSDNPGLATVNAASGVGVAGPARGTVNIIAQLLTGPRDVATLTIVSPPALLAISSGSGQTGPVSGTLRDPVVVRVTATDGGPAPGVPVTFAAGNNGTVTPASATTDANGLAQASWKLGPGAGAQSLTASAPGVSGTPVTFTATATPVDPVRVVVATDPPSSVPAGGTFGLVVNAVTAVGSVATTFTGPVTIALPAGTPGGTTLSGSTTVNAVAGVATFSGLRINRVGSYALAVSAPSLAGASTSSVQVTAGAATRLVFQNYPFGGAVAGAVLDPVTVEARDALGNLATTFTGDVTLTDDAAALLVAGARAAIRGSGVAAPSQAISGTTTVRAVGGIATFSSIAMSTAGARALFAASGSLERAVGPTFTVTAGSPSAIVLSSGGAQAAAGGAALPAPIVVQVVDRFGNGVAGRTVTFTPANGGSASPTSGASDAAGFARTTWTLGGAAGSQSMSVATTGLDPITVSATATSAGTGGGGSAGEFIVIHDVNWADNSYGTGAGNVQFMKNLASVPTSGARSSATKVMLLDFQTLSYYTWGSNWSNMAGALQGAGYTPYTTTNRADMTNVPADVKVVILHAPSGTFSVSEVNGLKAFLAQGGRVLYIGENYGFQYTLDALANLLGQMGATTQSTGDCVFEGLVITTNNALTANTNGFSVACASFLTPGIGDVVLFSTASGKAIVVQVKVSTTPSPAPLVAPALRTTARPAVPPDPATTIRPPRR